MGFNQVVFLDHRNVECRLEFLPVSDDEFSRELEQRHGECDNRGRPWEYAFYLDVLGDPPYNLFLHTAPAGERLDQTFHWHWEIHPRLRVIAGLERATALAVNPAAPEYAAQVLRERLHR